jgi:hypothetical protein
MVLPWTSPTEAPGKGADNVAGGNAPGDRNPTRQRDPESVAKPSHLQI